MTYFFTYVKRLKPFEKPDYELLKKFFRSMIKASRLQQEGIPRVLKFDWVMLVVDKVLKRKEKRDSVNTEFDDLQLEEEFADEHDCDLNDSLISEISYLQDDSLKMIIDRLENKQE